MKLNGKLPYRTTLCGLALLTLAERAGADSLSQAYCSPENTGSDYSPVNNIYQSGGSCSEQCRSDYAFAVVQGQDCWCSNYIPYDQQSTGDCNEGCPGYPNNLCGNTDDGLYGYIPLNIPASGTLGAPSSTQAPSTSTPDPSSSTSERTTSSVRPQPTVTGTVTREHTMSPSVVVSLVTPTSSTSPPPPSSSSFSSSSSSRATTKSISKTMSPHTSPRITTSSGAVVTQTVSTRPMAANPSDSSSDPPVMQRKGLSGGAIAGIVIGTLIGVAALLLAGFLLWRRRKNTDAEGGPGTTRSPKRNTSVLSKAGLLASVRPQSMAENNTEDPFAAESTTPANNLRHSMLFGSGAAGEGISPVSPLGSTYDGSSSRRQSKPLVYDQRLNPSALFANHENTSRVSVQDHMDYGRPLAISNRSFRSFRSSFDSR